MTAVEHRGTDQQQRFSRSILSPSIEQHYVLLDYPTHPLHLRENIHSRIVKIYSSKVLPKNIFTVTARVNLSALPGFIILPGIPFQQLFDRAASFLISRFFFIFRLTYRRRDYSTFFGFCFLEQPKTLLQISHQFY